ncbi:hypothetical protein LTR91_020038 [Friedmanniomyces endolithicus]|uniref:Uncharacterized protein n=1 Tax=Friedmanniomyces endolithicus TaxID=329885 RepID=A0AAN6H8J2_9PEZI|nr:hypothetical protein LTR94_015063 [Friedmanniomyces endolithicus]KAK0780796.1 hypothetical protein LTR38_013973 [Friedmanniomyces endolithicus]KAK0792014.1 hypothetical protein LTR59_008714 [Friedmanniomyces endolithicus]KAK0800500.1 hypothetical protein LTR75_008892 [Friedmanniomyces endolithicus]KAK0846642.1 hypothetical protein LTR03_006723 [Friedmanniomyces endolithicus]
MVPQARVTLISTPAFYGITNVIYEVTCTYNVAAPLFKLSPELRLQIYTHLLTFPTPIHLRQHVPGTPHTALLRTNRQIHHEAQAVLYDTNTISLSRNDFCLLTDPALQTPVEGLQVRHLRFTSFGESLACNVLAERCAVCKDDARGLLEALGGMPVLRRVTIDYSTQIASFMRFRQLAAEEGGSRKGLTVTCISVGVYRVHGAGFDQVDFTFSHRPLASIWPDLATLSYSLLSEEEQETVLARLRTQDPDTPDKLWLLLWAAQHGRLSDVLGEQVAGAWVDESSDALAGMNEQQRDAAMHGFTVMLQTFLKAHTAVQCRRVLGLLRDSVGM